MQAVWSIIIVEGGRWKDVPPVEASNKRIALKRAGVDPRTMKYACYFDGRRDPDTGEIIRKPRQPYEPRPVDRKSWNAETWDFYNRGVRCFWRRMSEALR